MSPVGYVSPASSVGTNYRIAGAGNSFLGGLSAGLLLAKGDVFEGVRRYFRKIMMLTASCLLAMLYATVSASFTIEQLGLPRLTGLKEGKELWNGGDPYDRLEDLRHRYKVSA